MGWAVYQCPKGTPFRHAGYGVPAYCDHPDCKEEIDRGVNHRCGSINSDGEDRGCGLYFCETHLSEYSSKYNSSFCGQCWPRSRKPFTPKPEHPEWATHVLSDESWQKFRDANPEWVAKLQEVVK